MPATFAEEGALMCEAMTTSGAFDPELCPLLKGLSHEEQAERMQHDPRIAACITAISGGRAPAEHNRPCEPQSANGAASRSSKTLASDN